MECEPAQVIAAARVLIEADRLNLAWEQVQIRSISMPDSEKESEYREEAERLLLHLRTMNELEIPQEDVA